MGFKCILFRKNLIGTLLSLAFALGLYIRTAAE